MNTKDLIFELVSSCGVSGDEFSSSEISAGLLEKYCTTEIDDFGNVIGYLGEFDEKKPTVMLDAHIDEIGFIVTYITDDGFLKVSNCGGIDRRLLLAQQVTVFGKEIVSGVVTSTPPHLEEDNKKVPKLDDVFVDVGLTKEECEKVISLGDRVIIANKPACLAGDRITGKSLDDRSGVAVILLALEMIKDKKLPVNVAVSFSVQEEVSGSGAKIAAYKIRPDYAVAIDVSFALTADDKEYKCSKLGNGAMIGIAPSLSRDFSDRVVEIAKFENIPYSLEIMNGRTGTNADGIGVTGKGVKTVTVSIPLKYMHTPVEVISISDIENIAKLVAKLLERGVFKDA